MTHEELLTKIKDFEADNELDASASMSALRAVVELHKPEQDFTNEIYCFDCQLDEYPCPTIQAIEKELN